MEMLIVLEALEDAVEKGLGIPLAGKCVVNRDEILELVKDIRLKLPDDIKQAQWVKEERQRILQDAQKEAENIIKSAEARIAALVNEHEISKRAYEEANNIIATAQKNARDIRTGAREYAESLLGRAEDTLKETIDVLHANREELRS